jgi:hypothetical protein
VPFAPALVGIGVLVLVLWVLATALAIAVVMGYISGALSGLPFPLDKLAGPVKALAQVITSACGKLETGIDHLIGAAWHQLARYMDSLWHQIEAQASLMAQFGEMVGGQIYSVSGLRALVHRLEKAYVGIEHGIKTLTREFHGIEHRVKVLEHDIAKGIGNDIRAQVRGLEREVHGIEKGVIPELRQGIKTAEGEVTQLENFIKAIPGTKYLTWATAIVAAGLGSALFNFFKCPTFLNKTLGRQCGFWNGLEDLFGLFIDTLLLANVCEILPFLETAVSDVADPIVIALTDVGAGLCSGGIGAAPALNVPALSLPANPGVTLNLP